MLVPGCLGLRTWIKIEPLINGRKRRIWYAEAGIRPFLQHPRPSFSLDPNNYLINVRGKPQAHSAAFMGYQ